VLAHNASGNQGGWIRSGPKLYKEEKSICRHIQSYYLEIWTHHPVNMDHFNGTCLNVSIATDLSRCDLGEDAPIYVQVLGTVIFVIVWPFIVMDIKYFPIGRPAAALVGALLMVVFHVVTQSDMYEIQGTKGNLQTVFLLIGMMMLSFYYDREGILHHIGLLFFGKANRSFKYILWKVAFCQLFFLH
jgi:hypothetical protein